MQAEIERLVEEATECGADSSEARHLADAKASGRLASGVFGAMWKNVMGDILRVTD